MNYKEILIEAGLDKEYPIAGISDEQISEIEQMNNITLPDSYKNFLRECGKSAGLFEHDEKSFYPDIKSLRKDLNEMIVEEEIDFILPENIFVFSAYQGFYFNYFLCDGNNDPVVYEITDGSNGPRVSAPSFTKYMEKNISQWKATYSSQIGNLEPV